MNFKQTLLGMVAGAGMFLGSANTADAKIYRSNASLPQYTSSLREFENSHSWDVINANPPKTLEEITGILNRIKVSNDDTGRHEMRSAKEVMQRGFGVCRHTAIAGAYFAEKLGYPAKVLDMREGIVGEGHMVTLIEDGSSGKIKYGAIDKDTLYYPEHDSAEGVVEELNAVHKTKYSLRNVIDLNSKEVDWRTGDSELFDVYYPYKGKAGLLMDDYPMLTRTGIGGCSALFSLALIMGGCGLFNILKRKKKIRKMRGENRT